MKKIIALLLVSVLSLGLFAGCGSTQSDEVVLPVQDVADTVENRQKAIRETAFAYYHKNPYHQYDDSAMSILGRTADGPRRTSAHMNNTPEMISEDQPVYHTCSGFVYHVIYHCFDLQIMGGWGAAVGWSYTKTMDDFATAQHTYGKDGVEDPAVIEQFRAQLQPGDVISYTRKSGSGHTVLWLGEDVTGDGTMDLINVDGKYYGGSWNADYKPGVEFREDGSQEKYYGGVDINADNWGKDNIMYKSGEYFLFNPKSGEYLGDKMSSWNSWRFTDKIAEYPLTERAKTRVLFPGLVITNQVEGGIFSAVTKGENLTYTLTMENKSEQDHKGILVQIPVPANSTLVSINGQAAKGGLVKASVDIPAGGIVKMTYTVQATGEVGSKIVLDGGYIHAIPLGKLTTAIRSGAEDGSAVFTAATANQTKTGMDFANSVYATMGKELNLPELKELQKVFYTEKRVGENKLFIPVEAPAEENKTLYNMAVTDFFGGQYVADGLETTRVKDLRARDMQAGDLLIWEEYKGDCQVAVHDGEKFLWAKNGKLVTMTQEDLDRFFTFRFFIALRPAQAR